MKKYANFSIVIPVYNEEKNIRILGAAISNALKKFRAYEVIFVDDGSTDNTQAEILNLKSKDSSVDLIRFRRNFGKTAALAAGFKRAKGKVIITMDGDLQDDPSYIPRFLEKIDEGYDLVVGWKEKKYRGYNIKIIPSKAYNILTRYFTDMKLHDFDCPFKAFRKNVASGLYIYGELHRYIPVLVNQKGFKIGEIKVKNLSRVHGQSKFNSTRILKGFLDLITVLFLTRFAKRPLHFFGSIGLILLLLGFILGLFLVIKRFIFGILIVQEEEVFILLTILFTILGVQFISLGLISEMLVYLNQMKKDENAPKEE